MRYIVGLASLATEPARAVVQMLLNDPTLRELVTYRLWASQSFSQQMKYNVDVFTEYPDLRVARMKANTRIVASLSLNLEAGDVLFLMFADDVPEGASQKDQIRDASGHIYKVASVHNIFNVATAFQVEGEAK